MNIKLVGEVHVSQPEAGDIIQYIYSGTYHILTKKIVENVTPTRQEPLCAVGLDGKSWASHPCSDIAEGKAILFKASDFELSLIKY